MADNINIQVSDLGFNNHVVTSGDAIHFSVGEGESVSYFQMSDDLVVYTESGGFVTLENYFSFNPSLNFGNEVVSAQHIDALLDDSLLLTNEGGVESTLLFSDGSVIPTAFGDQLNFSNHTIQTEQLAREGNDLSLDLGNGREITLRDFFSHEEGVGSSLTLGDGSLFVGGNDSRLNWEESGNTNYTAENQLYGQSFTIGDGSENVTIDVVNAAEGLPLWLQLEDLGGGQYFLGGVPKGDDVGILDAQLLITINLGSAGSFSTIHAMYLTVLTKEEFDAVHDKSIINEEVEQNELDSDNQIDSDALDTGGSSFQLPSTAITVMAAASSVSFAAEKYQLKLDEAKLSKVLFNSEQEQEKEDVQGDVTSTKQAIETTGTTNGDAGKSSGFSDALSTSEAANEAAGSHHGDSRVRGLDDIDKAPSDPVLVPANSTGVPIPTSFVSNGVVIDIYNTSLDTGIVRQSVVGAPGVDVLQATLAYESFQGNGTADTVSYANSGTLVVVNLAFGFGQAGFAQYDTFSGIKNIIGSPFGDILLGDKNDNVIEGGGGGDFIFGGRGYDLVSFASAPTGVVAGLDYFDDNTGDAAGDTYKDVEGFIGSAYADILTGDDESNGIFGGAGNDILYGGLGKDTLAGEAGDDLLYGGLGSDQLDGGVGNDTVSYEGEAAIVADLSNNTVIVGGVDTDTLTDIENVIGSNSDDEITGDASNNILSGLGGNDILRGEAGDDVLIGGEDADALFGGDGIDAASYEFATSGVIADLQVGGLGGEASGDSFNSIESLIGSGYKDFLYGDANNNTLMGGAGDDFLDGRSGFDTVSYASSNMGVEVDLSQSKGTGGAAVGDTYASIEGIVGSNYADILWGDQYANTLSGLAGNDELHGRAGNDIFLGSVGEDEFYGDDGSDTVNYSTSDFAVVVNLASGIGSGTDSDAVGDKYTSIENAVGSIHNDRFVGGSEDNIFEGGLGRDAYVGGAGSDWVSYENATSGITMSFDGNSAGTPVGESIGDTFVGMENVIGSAYADAIRGSAGKNTILAGDGDDRVWGLAGEDILEGGAGADSLYGGSYADILRGDAGNDLLNGGFGHDELYGGQGDDELLGSDGNDLLEGGIGNDYLHGGNQNDTLRGGEGNDELFGGAGIDSLDGGLGDDILRGNAGNDRLYGSEGDDHLDGGGQHDVLDYVNITTGGVHVDLQQGKGFLGAAINDTYANFEDLSGTNFDDILIGTTGDNTIPGSNTISGGDGNDVIYGLGSKSGVDQLFGQDGNDVMHAYASAEKFFGGDGVDTVNYAMTSGPVTVNLKPGQSGSQGAAGDVYDSIENIVGTSSNDSITGNMLNNTFHGGAGDDQLFGEDGNDILDGGAGADQLTGGKDFDLASYASSQLTGVTASLVAGATLLGDAKGDTYTTIEGLEGTKFDDTLSGDNANNTLIGLDGNDTLRGADGNDLLIGGAGADDLQGGAGFDTASYRDSPDAVQVSFGGLGVGGDAQGDEYTNIESLEGSLFNDELTGDEFGNTLSGLAGKDVLQGMDGNDVLIGGAGADLLEGGAGVDTASYVNAEAAVNIDLELVEQVDAGSDANGDVFVDIENVAGSNYGDTLKGDDKANTLSGLDGDDTLIGRDGNDLLIGGLGKDDLQGGLGDDTASYAGAAEGITLSTLDNTGSQGEATGDLYSSIERFIGTDYDDVFHAGDSAYHYDGGAGGANTVNYSQSNLAVTVNLNSATGSAGFASGDTYANITDIVGSAFGDDITGNASANRLVGGEGADTLTGLGGDDILIGDAGNNTLLGGLGGDDLQGGTGTDTASYVNAVEGIKLSTIDHTGSAGEAAGDTFSSIERFIGTNYDDTFYAGNGTYHYDGGTGGANTVDYGQSVAGVTVNLKTGEGSTGYAATDTYANITHVVGSANDDHITGDDKDNTFISSEGKDTYIGEAGDDTVSYAGAAAGITLSTITNAGSVGEAAGDTYASIERFIGTNQSDYFNAGSGQHHYDGGTGGENTLNYSQSGAGVTVNLTSGVGSGGYAANDTYANLTHVVGSAHNDDITGNLQNNTFTYTGGFNMYDGVAGVNTVDYSGATLNDLVVDLSNEQATFTSILVGAETLKNIDNVTGTDGNDHLFGNSTSSTSNILLGLGGNDRLRGGEGDDLLDGGLGQDIADYSEAASFVTVNLDTGVGGVFGETDTLISIERVYGSKYDDTISASMTEDVDNIFYGGSGNDTLHGYKGADILYGGLGDDQLFGGAGNDLFYDAFGENKFDGGAGTDEVNYMLATDYVGVSLLESGEQKEDGEAKGDTLTDIENLTGSNYNDQLIGDGEVNILKGLDGNDLLRGGAKNDMLDGGLGFDTADYSDASGAVTVDLNAGTGSGLGIGADTLTSIEAVIGSNYKDTLRGDGNDNTFIYSGGSDTYIGRGGMDTVDYSKASIDSLVVNLSTGQAVSTQSTETLVDIENVIGTEVSDQLTGTTGMNSLSGLGGDDRLQGGLDKDVLDGGAGFDIVDYSYASSSVTVNLGAGIGGIVGEDDTLVSIEGVVGSDYKDTLTGDANANTFIYSSGSDTYDGVAGVNTVDYSAASLSSLEVDLSKGEATSTQSTETLINIDNVTGTNANDHLFGNDNPNILLGLEGNDLLRGGEGVDTLDGGLGQDIADYSQSAHAIAIDLDAGTGIVDGETDTLISIERVYGSDYADIIFASKTLDVDNIFYGNSGIDILKGYIGDDILYGGAGKDELHGGDGADTLYGGLGDDELFGGKGNDLFIDVDGNNVFTGGNDIDEVSYATATDYINVSLLVSGKQTEAGEAQGDELISIENVTGTNFNDVLYGNDKGNTLKGLDGNDLFRGGSKDDILDGGEGQDVVDYSVETKAVAVDLEAGTGTGGSIGTDTLVSIEKVYGSDYDDTIAANTSGDAVNNLFYGNAGNDTLHGFGGADTLYGGAGNDQLFGGAGNDLFYDAVGENTFDGGADTDEVNYSLATSAVNVSLLLSGVIQTGTGTGAGAAQNDILTSIENLTGTNFDDVLIGQGGDNTLTGLDGNDRLQGGAGNDTLYGGLGIDTADYSDASGSIIIDLNAGTSTGAGNDTLDSIENVIGSNHQDTLRGDANANTFIYSAGSDTYNGRAGIDTVDYSMASIDSLVVNLSTGQAVSTQSSETLVDIENVIGSASNDELIGDGGDNILTGLAGNDQLQGGLGNDTLDGGADFDIADYSAAAGPITVDLGAGTGTGMGNDTLISIESVYGSNQDDTIHASTTLNVNNIFYGGDGADELKGFLGNDELHGGDGNDRLFGGQGNDLLAGDGGENVFYGGSGVDEVTYAASASYVDVSLAASANPSGFGGDALNDQLSGIENLTGTSFNDHLIGDDNVNILKGSDGNDRLDGGLGNDTLDGGLGQDIADYSEAASFVTVNLDTGVGGVVGETDTLISIERAYGSKYDDTISASTTEDVDNIFYGGSGNDTIKGFIGEDTLYGGIGNDELHGGDGADTLYGGTGDDELSGGKGNDLFIDVDGVNVFNGGNDTDEVNYATATGSVTLSLSIASASNAGQAAGAQFISIENLTGSNFNDFIYGDFGANVLKGLQGDDFFVADLSLSATYGGGDIIDGGTGNDSVDYFTAQHALNVNLQLGTVIFGTATGISSDTLSSIENVYGSQYDDQIFADNTASVDNILSGKGGNDNLYGFKGNDTLYGGEGNDRLEGGDGDDVLYGEGGVDEIYGGLGNDHLYGGDANDTLHGGGGNDVFYVAGGAINELNGDSGTDEANYSLAVGPVSVTLFVNSGPEGFAGEAQGDEFTSIENLTGSSFGDVLWGNTGPNTIRGGAGNDELKGGDANDILSGDAGEDILDGGSGIDEATYQWETSGVNVYLETVGQQTFAGAATGDTLISIENLTGTDFNDILWGHAGENTLRGGDGNDNLVGRDGIDSLYGDNGSDTLHGGAGNDSLFGGEGNDYLTGSTGADTLKGDDGNDVFLYYNFNESSGANIDTIDAFIYSDDKLDFSNIPQAPTSNPLLPEYIGSNPFSGTFSEIRTEINGSGDLTALHYDYNGDGAADLSINFTNSGAPGFTMTNFIF